MDHLMAEKNKNNKDSQKGKSHQKIFKKRNYKLNYNPKNTIGLRYKHQ
jgi:hypothetical protein